MKGFVIGLIFGVVAIGATVSAEAAAVDQANLYPTCGVVTEVDRKDDIVTFTEFNGNMFSFYGADDWQEGDVIAATMDNNKTPVVYDDRVVKVSYKGYGWKF